MRGQYSSSSTVDVPCLRGSKLIRKEFPVVLVKWDEEEGEGDEEEEEGAGTDNDARQDDPFAADSANGNAEAGPSRVPADEASAPSTAVKPRRRRLKIVDTFHSYVRPVWSKELSEFCVKFTGITQVCPSCDIVRAASRWHCGDIKSQSQLSST